MDESSVGSAGGKPRQDAGRAAATTNDLSRSPAIYGRLPYVRRGRIIVLISESAEEHIEADHEVAFAEVLEAAANRGLLFPTRWGRSALLGVTDAGRLLRVILEPDETDARLWWVITALDATDRDRRTWKRLSRRHPRRS